MSRLAQGGLIDRSHAVPFRFNGRALAGFAGDTLASALLANDVRLVGRSFKYHRPRGIVTAGSEEPNALVTLGTGADQTPNLRATTLPLFDGLAARSQNHVGPLGWDLLAVNDWLSPFLGAGFYYKTFMWPKAFWEKVYEPAIRRAAGLGALSGAADPDAHDKAWAYCDLLVIGAGPAGLMAALVAGRAGRQVILADEDARAGGRLLADGGEIDGQAAVGWVAGVMAELRALPNVRIMERTAVLGAYDGGTYAAWQQHASPTEPRPAGLPPSSFWRIVAGAAVLATGAHERLIAFPGNDRPGIMQAGALRSYINRFAVAPGRRISLFTTNDEGWRTARACLDAGIAVGAVIDPRADAPMALNCPVHLGAQVIDTRGRLGLAGIRIRRADGATEWIETDCLGVSGGWNPAVHIASHTGAKPRWADEIAAFVATDDMAPGLRVAGAAAGVYSTQDALRSGADAAARALGMDRPADVPRTDDAAGRMTPLWYVEAPGRAWLDLQNDVTVKDVKQAHQENFANIEHMKRYTTMGMATDQGKMGNVPALAIMAELTGQSIPETGITTFRPPYVPVPIAAMGAGGAGHGFAPERFLPTHEDCMDRRAPMIEVGQWYRPGWFPRDGETHWRQSCDREVAMVRGAVGVTDVSSLGKIDVQGPDAARFLDFVYTNMMSNLPVGKVRYGLMLREDGFVMDDGTCARLADTHFLLTTTTAAAGQVMAHLEFVAQCLKPDWDVQMTSVSDHWAQFAIAGPRARDVIASVLDQPVDGATLPFMGHCELPCDGRVARLFRISFSGELGFELAVPARMGAEIWDKLVALAEDAGGGAYGLEALNVLRIEKGFITHAEIHGRVTAADIGMGRMMSGRKDFIGKAMAGRSDLARADRQVLVGLKPVGAVQKLLSGSHILAPGAEAAAANDLGYVTSVCHSPTLGHMIGLGFVQRDHARVGTQLRCVDLLRDFDTLCDVVPTPFLDPDGERMRG